MRILVCFFSLLLANGAAQCLNLAPHWAMASVTYYVDPDGNDTFDGSRANPWKTIRHAVGTVVAGDTVLINPGTYLVDQQISITTSGTASNPITFKGNGVGVVVDLRSCDAKNCLEIFFADYIVIDNLTVYASLDPNSRGIRLTHAQGCKISNNTVSGANHANLFCSLSDHVTFINNEAFGGAIGIYMADSSDYPTIKGNRLHDNTAIGLHMNGDINSGGDGTISHALVDSNMIYNNGATGINLDGVTLSTFQNNLVYGNTYRGIAFFQQDGAVPSNDNEALQNTIITPAGAYYGIGLNYGANRNSFYNNIILTEGSVPSFSSTSSTGELQITSNHNLLPDQGRVAETSNGRFSFSEWQAIGYDTQSVTESLTQTFQDPAGADYQLKPGSPAIDAGTIFHTCTPDIVGNTRPSGTAPDTGAYEFQTIVYISPDGLCGNHTPCYSRIQEGFDWPGGINYTLKVQQGSYDENLVLNSDRRIEVNGGWDETFTTRTSGSGIKSLQILNGTVSGRNLVIQ
ncbi:MAG: right-handed parallel beta-helix repeat-containing protein [Deltaproteobacteria bacterium]|nr:right-handed parallel beta-helix repeat-containing protein [Deltaproteobacteria bacterium]